MAISDYFINGYCWLFYCRPLVVILLVVIDVILLVAINDYFINGDWQLFFGGYFLLFNVIL
jgi:hypothetical protein